MRFIQQLPCIILGCVFATGVAAHEFWLSPEQFLYAPGEEVQVDLRVGQEFSGPAYSYNERNFTRFETILDGETSVVGGRLGNVPAMTETAPEAGLMIVVHETSDALLSYTVWDKFVKFVEHKAFPTTLEDHVARGLAKDEKFTESYRRFAKSLIAIGTGSGADRETGLRTEIIALENPYKIDDGDLSVKVMFEGAPKIDAQIEMFEKAADGTVEITLHRTDDAGEAVLPVKRGYTYLLDSVEMVALDNDDPTAGPVWESLWASLTFAVPDAPLD